MTDRRLEDAGRRLRVLIAAYLGKSPLELEPTDIDVFKRKFIGFCKEELGFKGELKGRIFERWMTDGSAIYGGHHTRIMQFFRKRWTFFDEAILFHDINSFDTNFYRKLAEHTRTLVIQLNEPLRAFTDRDREFLIGVYELYRHSFANEGKINVDIMVIKPDTTNPTMLQMELIVGALREDNNREHFRGPFCHYGHSLLGLPVFIDATENDRKYARVRRYEFSDEGLIRTSANLVKLGIVSGNSIQLGYPVAARCLISKLSNDPEQVAAYAHIPDRYDANRLYADYVEAISNDVRKKPLQEDPRQDDKLLVAWPSRRPNTRPREHFPVLPIDPADPLKTRWLHR